jgi:histidine triad (HIT) family protein
LEPTLFSKIIAGEIPASFVAKGEGWVAFLDINPRAEGHTLVVPVEEAQHLQNLSSQSRAAVGEGVAEVTRRLCAHFGVEDCTIVTHDGPAAGQEIPHVHVHVIPRSEADGGHSILAMFPDTPSPGSIEPDFAALAALAAELSD